MEKPYSNFDQGHTSRWFAISGLVFTTLFALSIIIVGGVELGKLQVDAFCFPGVEEDNPTLFGFGCIRTEHAEIISLALNVLITICTETVGFVHATTLQWSLAHENRLTFHANIRLFSASHKRFSANGVFANLFMSALLIISFACSPLVVFSPFSQMVGSAPQRSMTPYWPALILLGVALLAQVSVAVFGMITTPVKTWSNSVLDYTAAYAFTGAQREEGNAMLDVRAREAKLPWMSFAQRPEKRQISAWKAHRRVRYIIYYIWILVTICLICFGVVYYATFRTDKGDNPFGDILKLQLLEEQYGAYLKPVDKPFSQMNSTELAQTLQNDLEVLSKEVPNFEDTLPESFTDGESVNGTFRWTLVPTFERTSSNGKTWSEFGWGGSKSTLGDLVFIVLFISVVQGSLTLGLHCAELIVILTRDEQCWRQASTKKGITTNGPTTTVIWSVLSSWQSCGLLIAKPSLHWFFTQGFSVLAGDDTGDWKHIITFAVHPSQMLNLSLAVLLFSLVVTVVTNHHPKGPQPAAYGHIPTLLDLIDEWHPRMFWGHKGVYGFNKDAGSLVYHAGTSDAPLPPVRIDCLYR